MKKTLLFTAIAALFSISSIARAEVPGHYERKMDKKYDKMHHKRMKMHARWRQERREERMNGM